MIPEYYIAYWRDHVFPIEFSQLSSIKEYMEKYIENFKTPDRQFAVIPGASKFWCAVYNHYLSDKEEFK